MQAELWKTTLTHLYGDARPDEVGREGTIAKTLDGVTSLMQAHSDESEGRAITGSSGL
jgi:hypothetical protein